MSWYQDLVVDTGRAPALWLLVGFLLTFAITRWVTRRIRAREVAGEAGGGVVSNIHIGGVHVHHQVWGILLVLVTGLLVFRFSPESPWLEVLAALFGAGAALALDEFALWLHLDDVYWSAEGRRSIDAVMVAVVLAGALLLEVSPVGVSRQEDQAAWSFAIAVALHFAFVIVAFLKGKQMLGLIGIVVPVVALVAAIRLAKPSSYWARRRYAPAKAERARRRFSDEYRARWDRIRDRIGGSHDRARGGAVDRYVTGSLDRAAGDDAAAGPAAAPRGPSARHDGGGS